MSLPLTQLSPKLQAMVARAEGGTRPPPKAAAVHAADALMTNIIPQQSMDEAKLNKLEREYLALLRAAGHPWIGVQCVTFKLGNDCRYTPDFVALDKAGVFWAHEVKGFMRDDALVKLKTAARAFPWVRFVLVTKKAGEWQTSSISP